MTASLATPAQPPRLKSGRTFLSYHAYRQRTALACAVTAGVLSTICMLVQWWAFAYVADQALVAHIPLNSLTSLLVIFAAMVFFRAILARVQGYFAQRASVNIRQYIRKEMLRYWRSASPIALKDTSPGASAAQWIEEVEAMDGYFSRYWPQQLLAIISPLLIVALIAYVNWLCALLLLVSAPLIPLFMVLIGMGAEKLNQKYSTIRQRLSGHFLDRVGHICSIKILGGEQEVLEEVDYYSTQYRKVIMKTLKLAFLSSTVLEFFTSIAIASLAIYIGFSLFGAITWGPAESLSLFTGLLILILAPEFFQPMRNLSQYYHDRATALGAANNLVLLLNTKALDSSAKPNQNKAPISPFNGQVLSSNTPSYGTSIHVKQLLLRHTSQYPLTKPITFSAHTGNLVVITGDSGVGKSTLLCTIANYVPYAANQIEILPNNNVPIAFLPQTPWIKNTSVYKNLAALAPQASRNDMLAVLDLLGLTTELGERRDCLSTLIGEHGQGLSGGQMQRIALARVLLNPCPIVLLDEPTAKLDEKSKQKVIAGIKHLLSNSLVIVATHDPLLIALADVRLNLAPITRQDHAILV